jgi:hypothetical protein
MLIFLAFMENNIRIFLSFSWSTMHWIKYHESIYKSKIIKYFITSPSYLTWNIITSMSWKPIIWEYWIWKIWSLLLILNHINAICFKFIYKSLEFFYSFLGRLLIIFTNSMHELIISECFFIQEKMSWFNHQNFRFELWEFRLIGFLVSWEHSSFRELSKEVWGSLLWNDLFVW